MLNERLSIAINVAYHRKVEKLCREIMWPNLIFSVLVIHRRRVTTMTSRLFSLWRHSYSTSFLFRFITKGRKNSYFFYLFIKKAARFLSQNAFTLLSLSLSPTLSSLPLSLSHSHLPTTAAVYLANSLRSQGYTKSNFYNSATKMGPEHKGSHLRLPKICEDWTHLERSKKSFC